MQIAIHFYGKIGHLCAVITQKWPCDGPRWFKLKKMSKCQKDVKMSKSQTHRLWRRFTKKINWHNEVHTYWHQFWRQIWRSPKLFKTLSMYILRVFGHHHMWHQNWHQYVWTSLCEFIFFVNLLHSPCVWLFDSLTSFWQIDIFLTYDIWATGHMGNGTHGQRDIMVNIKDRDVVPWGIGHMGNWAHDHNFLNTAWIFTKILLDIDIDVFYLNIQWYSHDGLFKYKNS